MYCWSLAWRILSITELALEVSAIVWWFEHSLVLPFLGTGMRTDLSLSCDHWRVFKICWHIECNTLTASSFKTLNSSAGIPSPPLTLFIVMLPKATWLYIPGCLALGEWSQHHDCLGCKDLFCKSSSVYSCHLFLRSASVRFLSFLSFIVHHLAWNVPLISVARIHIRTIPKRSYWPG